jgi:hypothetical protein
VIELLSTSACSLAAEERSERATRLYALEQRAVSRNENSLRFPLDLELARELAELAVLEAGCCGAGFTLDVEPAGLSLTLKR